MSTKKYIAMGLLITGLFASCDSMNTFPEGEIVTEDQSNEVVQMDESKMMANINAMNAVLIAYNTLDLANAAHYDFGYPGLCMMMDGNGQDFVSADVGYNHFRSNLTFQDRTYDSNQSEFVWKLLYMHAKSANVVIKQLSQEGIKENLLPYKGAAYASRAFDYLNLIQLYQFTYDGHKDKLGVPILDENVPTSKFDNPRETVEDVYQFILGDLNNAITLLDGFKRSQKSVPDQRVAYGLRARVHLLMGNWKEAAEDAEKAMDGFTPYSVAEAGSFKFTDIADASWMWGLSITETNRVVTSGIINWPSHMCALARQGYTVQTGTHRKINKFLWRDIPTTDVRKGWWLDIDTISPLTAGLPETAMDGQGKLVPIIKAKSWEPYTNIKFGTYQGDVNGTTNASDWPLMRVEEMYLIRAEALARGGKLADGKQVLTDFVKTYRDASFVSKAGSLDDFVDEVWFHRRVELWGEGYAFFDLMRLKKPMVRHTATESAYDDRHTFNLPAEAPIFLWRVPQSEMNSNNAIPEDQNNPIIAIPKPEIIG